MLFFKQINRIQPRQLKDKLSENPVIIDVREAHEFASGHIPNAVNIPLAQIASYESDQPIYVICHSGMRSRKAAKVLERKGLDVTTISGGMSKWTGPIKKGR